MATKKTPSIFTQIIERKIPANIRYEDDEFIAIDDIRPQAPVHILLIPKEPITTLEHELAHAKLDYVS